MCAAAVLLLRWWWGECYDLRAAAECPSQRSLLLLSSSHQLSYNWALQTPEQSGRSTPMDITDIQSGIRYHPQEKLPQSRRFLHTSVQIYSSSSVPLIAVFSLHVFSLLFPFIKTLNWLTHTYWGEDPFGKNLQHQTRFPYQDWVHLSEHCPSLIHGAESSSHAEPEWI